MGAQIKKQFSVANSKLAINLKICFAEFHPQKRQRTKQDDFIEAIAYQEVDKLDQFDVNMELCYENASNERINFTPLLLATMGGCHSVIEKLIDLGARINQVIYDINRNELPPINHHHTQGLV